ncbi:primosomal protein N' [Eubacteriaceae bacterium ES2]|nr:primosomal protein N' [Eubacteriaceae bacterium ES2]
MKVAEVYLKQNNKRLDQSYYYYFDDDTKIKSGIRVIVAFGRGNRELEAFVVRLLEIETSPYPLKPILEVIDAVPVLNKEQIELCIFMKTYYCSMFYENLAYFVSARPVKRQSYLKLDLPEMQFEHEQSEIVSKYFDHGLLEIPESKVLKTDRGVINKMIARGYIKRKNILILPKTIDEKRYFLKSVPESFKAGKIQSAIIKLLEFKSMKESELKQLIPGYRASLSGLIKKGLVQEEIPYPGQLYEDSDQIRNTRNVLLSANEEAVFHQYKKMIVKGCFLKNNDSVSKFRLLFKIIQEKLATGKSVVLLFPEINLSYQKFELFFKYFGEYVGLYHHKLSPKEQRIFWEDVKNGKIRLVLGVQGALFLPFRQLDLIVVENESDPAYYTIGVSKFHLPDLVRQYAGILNCQYLLIDESPDIKTFYQIKNKELEYIEIGKRSNSNKPQIINMQVELKEGNLTPVSRVLNQAILKSSTDRKLTVILANRIGYTKAVVCKACGKLQKCPHCQVALTYNDKNNSLECSYCGFQEKKLDHCQYCDGRDLRYQGSGVKNLYEYLKKRYPQLKIVLVLGGISSTEIKSVNSKIKNKEIDILIGTQVLAKHFDFSNVGVAASFFIDRDINLGTYDAAEISYNIYSRFFKKALNAGGVGFIQTSDPQNDLLLSIQEDDYEAFYQGELIFRKTMNYPPYLYMVVFKIRNCYQELVKNDAMRLYILLNEKFGKMEAGKVFLYKPVHSDYTDEENFIGQIILKIKDIDFFQQKYNEIIKKKDLEKIKSKISLEVRT